MAYEFLEKLYGETAEGEEPKAMTFEELVAALDANKDIKVVDIKEGGYVDKDKFDSKVSELSGVKKQLDEANAEIQSYKDMDIDGIKKAAEDWEAKYNADTKALNEQLTAQERNHQVDLFFQNYKFTSKPAQKGIRDEFEKKEFKLEDGKFLGAEDFMNGLMEDEDYKGAFVVEASEPSTPEPEPEPPAQQQQDNGGTNLPRFASGTSQQQASGKKMSLTEMMRRKNEDPKFSPKYE